MMVRVRRDDGDPATRGGREDAPPGRRRFRSVVAPPGSPAGVRRGRRPGTGRAYGPVRGETKPLPRAGRRAHDSGGRCAVRTDRDTEAVLAAYGLRPGPGGYARADLEA